MSFICDKSTGTTTKSIITNNSILIPLQAYLYFPIENSKHQRKLYEGNIQLSQKENDLLNKISATLSPTKISKSDILRYIYHCGFKEKNVIKLINQYIISKSHYLKYSIENPPDSIMKLLNIGFIYVIGRDNQFRPIIMIDIPKVKDVQNKLQKEQMHEVLFYFFSFIIEYLMLPGQIEKWSVIMLSKNESLEYSKDFNFVFNNIIDSFPCRLHSLDIIECDDISAIMWKFFKIAIENKVRKKDLVTIYKSNDKSYKYLKNMNKEQLERKAGGSLINKTDNFFPPDMSNTKTFVEGNFNVKYLISKEEYSKKMQKESRFYRINHSLLIKVSESQNINKECGILKSSPKSTEVVVSSCSNKDNSTKNEQQGSRNNTEESNTIINQIREYDPIRAILPSNNVSEIIMEKEKTEQCCILENKVHNQSEVCILF